MSIATAPRPDVTTTRRLPLAPACLDRPDPGLVVFAFAEPTEIALAGELLRPAPALALVPVPAMVWPMLPPGVGPAVALRHQAQFEGRRLRALALAVETAVRAGFDVRAGETVVPDRLPARLRDLDRRQTVLVAGGDRPARLHALRRVTEAAVLALPAGAPAAPGPAVIPAAHARRCMVTVARMLATERVVLVGPPSPDLDAARAFAEQVGLVVERVGGSAGDAARTIAGELDGVLVDAGHGRRRLSVPTRQELRDGRPVLIVAPADARR